MNNHKFADGGGGAGNREKDGQTLTVMEGTLSRSADTCDPAFNSGDESEMEDEEKNWDGAVLYLQKLFIFSPDLRRI